MTHRLLFFSNLFPTKAEPYRGLDNATLLHALSSEFDIRVLSPRPTLPWARPVFEPRPGDASLNPRWGRAAYLPKIGDTANHLLMASSLRRDFERLYYDFRPSILLSSWIFPDSIAALRLSASRIPVASIAQGSDIHQYLQMPARRRVILKHLPEAGAVITRSADLGRILKDADFPSEKLHTIYNGVDLSNFRPHDPAIDPPIPPSPRLILFVGNFYPVKNPLLLIRAVAQLQNPHPVSLIMIGGGPLEKTCRNLIAELNLTSRVLLAGRKTADEIAPLMRAADLLALPSQNEGVPNVILEAFASGTPVVASHVGGIPEVLNHPSLGRTFPPGDLPALVAALAEQLSTPRDSAAIRAHGQRFSWPASAAQYRDLLLSLIP